MKSLSGRELARLVEQRGWRLLRISGSHHVYGRTGSVVRLSIPIHGNHPLKVGLLRHLARLAGICEDELQK
jgi:predicted RNA binding protein YcfA (HicA-like mRNA interferase family)